MEQENIPILKPQKHILVVGTNLDIQDKWLFVKLVTVLVDQEIVFGQGAYIYLITRVRCLADTILSSSKMYKFFLSPNMNLLNYFY